MKISISIDGKRLVDRAFLLLDSECRKECIRAVDESSADAVREAKARVPKKTGELESTIRREINTDGLAAWLQVGYGSLQRSRNGHNERSQIAYWLRHYTKDPSADAPGVYAMVVNYGDAKRHHAAHPFIEPAIAAVLPRHRRRIKRALDNATARAAR